MTTSQKPETRTIHATIKGKMEKQGLRGRYFDIQLLIQGRKYPETIKCWDVNIADQLPTGQPVQLVLLCDGLKQDGEDDGQIASYWWSIQGLGSSPVNDEDVPPDEPPSTIADRELEAQRRALPVGMAQGLPSQPQRKAGSAVSEPPPNPAALGACQNHAVGFIVSGIIQLPEGRDLTRFVRQWRDYFYRNINQVPLAPLHYCYEHEAQRQQSPKTSAWGHVLPDGTPCVEVA